MVFPVIIICPPLEQGVPKDNFVSFSILLFSGVPQRQPHTVTDMFYDKFFW